MHYLKYLFGALITIPLLPIMYFQGKRVRASVPPLPEATGGEGTAQVSEAEYGLRMLVVGESTMAGVGVSTHDEGFAGSLAAELSEYLGQNIHWKVYARSGYTAKLVAERLVPKMEEKEVDLIIVGLGGNDSFMLSTPWKWRRDITTLVTNLREKYPEVPIMFGSMPPTREFAAFTPLIRWVLGNQSDMLGEHLAALVKTLPKVYFYHQVVTLAQWMKKFDIQADFYDFFSDGVHPSKLTYQVMARDMAQFVVSKLT